MYNKTIQDATLLLNAKICLICSHRSFSNLISFSRHRSNSLGSFLHFLNGKVERSTGYSFYCSNGRTMSLTRFIVARRINTFLLERIAIERWYKSWPPTAVPVACLRVPSNRYSQLERTCLLVFTEYLGQVCL